MKLFSNQPFLHHFVHGRTCLITQLTFSSVIQPTQGQIWTTKRTQLHSSKLFHMKFNMGIVKRLGPKVWSSASLGFEVQTFQFKLDTNFPKLKKGKKTKCCLYGCLTTCIKIHFHTLKKLCSDWSIFLIRSHSIQG